MFWRQGDIIMALVDVKITMTLINQQTTMSQMNRKE